MDNKEENLKKLYVVKRLNKACIRIAHLTGNQQEYKRTSQLDTAIDQLNYKINHNQPISDDGKHLLHDVPLLLKRYGITSHTIQVLKQTGIMK